MGLQVLGQVGDALAHDSDLHFGAAGIARLGGVFGNDLSATLIGDRHRVILL